MRTLKMLHLLALLCFVVLLAACGRSAGSAGPAPANPSPEPVTEQKGPAVKAIDKGHIVQKDGNRWLITAYAEKNGTPSIAAYWFTVTGETVLETGLGQTVTPDKMAVGAQVEAWHTGKVAESYPAQTTAAKIVMQEEQVKLPEGTISQSAAVQSALQSLTGTTAATAIKNVSLQTDDGYWTIELVRHETPDQPQTRRIDARSGKGIPTPVAENDAFRIFAPKPGTKVPKTFTVEGEARVFEAAFSWELEDGHNILAKGHEMAEEGAPAWGRFKFEVSYENASQPNLMLILFIHSAKDGSIQHQLILPLKAS